MGDVGAARRQKSGFENDQQETGTGRLSTEVHAERTGRDEDTRTPEYHQTVRHLPHQRQGKLTTFHYPPSVYSANCFPI